VRSKSWNRRLSGFQSHDRRRCGSSCAKVAGNGIAVRKTEQTPPPDPRLQDYQLSVFQCGSWDHIHNANFQGECEGVTLGSAPNTYTCPSIPASPVSSSPYLKPTTIVWPHSVSTFQRSRSNRILCSPRRIAAIAPRSSVHSFRACRPDSAVMKNTSFCKYCVDTSVAAFKKPDRLL